ELFLSGTQFVEEVKRGVDGMVWTRTWAVDLVNHHNGLETQRQGLARHEARLGHRALYGVDQQKHAVYHGKHALNFATEVRVSRGINDVDMNAFIFDSAVLGQNGDTPFLFDVTGVHDPFGHLLVVAECTRLAEQLIDQRCLAVIDVCDDRHITQCAFHKSSFCVGAAGIRPAGKACRGISVCWGCSMVWSASRPMESDISNGP